MADADIAGILDDVVHQFSEPLVFLRELIQNSIDAGTREIEISIDRDNRRAESPRSADVPVGTLAESPRSADAPVGTLALITVEDWGSGMTREIIDRQLCRLFSSTKYGDYTQIGRFGIGFVSVYAIEPEWVCVDTGRGGENWRVLFLPDHSFEVYRLREPIEGTRVTVAKRLRAERFEEFRESCREVVGRWCKHVPLPVYFDQEDVREPFEVEALCAAEHREEGTRLVAGLVAEMHPRCSFYNRGLLLKETEDARWPHLQFKVDSRYLDHTLTRDDIVHDKGYERIDVILDRIATEDLPRRLMNELAEAAADADLESLRDLYPLVASLEKHAPETVGGWQRDSIFPAVDRDPSSLREVEKAERKRSLFFAHGSSELARRVARENMVLLVSNEREFALRFGLEAPLVEQRFALVRLQDPTNLEFEGALAELFRLHGEVDPVFRSARVEAEALVPAFGRGAHGIIELDLLRVPSVTEAGELTLVVDHPLTAACLARAQTDPDIAARAFFAAIYPRLAGQVCRQGIEAMR